jgi:hypothetical protein
MYNIEASFFVLKMNLFPHKYRSFTAMILSSMTFSIAYVFILFFVFSLIYFTHFAGYRSLNYVRELTEDPSSIQSHINYLKFLTAMNRLDESAAELRYIALYRKYNPITAKEHSDIEELSNSIATKRVAYSKTLSEYAYWSRVVNDQPNYRDGKYELSRYSFMLFNSRQSIEQLRSVLSLDPLFESGSLALHELEKYKEITF